MKQGKTPKERSIILRVKRCSVCPGGGKTGQAYWCGVRKMVVEDHVAEVGFPDACPLPETAD